MPKQSYARVVRSIWANPDFRALSAGAQWLYFVLLTDPKTTLAGVSDWRPKRLSQYAQAVPVDALESAGQELIERRFICVDDDTEEALIRTFVRHDGMLKQPNMAIALAKEYPKIVSEYLRGVFVHELQRLQDSEPDLHWEHLWDVLSMESIDPSENPSGNPSDDPSENPSVWGDGDPSENPSPTPNSKLLTPISKLPRSSSVGKSSSPTPRGKAANE